MKLAAAQELKAETVKAAAAAAAAAAPVPAVKTEVPKGVKMERKPSTTTAAAVAAGDTIDLTTASPQQKRVKEEHHHHHQLQPQLLNRSKRSEPCVRRLPERTHCGR